MLQELFAVGKIVGTGSAIHVHLGFIPRYVRLFNASDATVPFLEWFQGMPAGYAHKTLISTKDLSSYAASGCISEYAGTDAQGDGAGFTLGTDSDLNGSTDVIFYLALR
jgi:hypothetical protein